MSLRRSLYLEPRPWWIGWNLHNFNHWLDDRNAAQVFRWCVSVFKLENSISRKLNAYRYSQELFKLLEAKHKISDRTFAMFLALCEAGGDLSSAYTWIKYYIEKHQKHELWHYVWLLRIARNSPCDEDVEEIVVSVREVLEVMFPGDGMSEERLQKDCEAVTDVLLVKEAFRLMRWLLPKLQDEALKDWILAAGPHQHELNEDRRKLPHVSTAAGVVDVCRTLQDVQRAEQVNKALHIEGSCGAFPLLELGIRKRPLIPTIKEPHLIDSLLHDGFVEQLENASFSQDVKTTTASISAYLEDISSQQETLVAHGGATGGSRPLHHHRTETNPIPVWRDYRDETHRSFRYSLVKHNGVPSELYHYLIVSMARSSPTLALSTKKKMEGNGMRLLDLTRAVLVASSRGNEEAQIALIKEQEAEVLHRKKLDGDHSICKAVEAYWKLEYPLLFHYRNALSMCSFYELLMQEIGVVETQRLVSVAHAIEEESVVVINDDIRDAAANVLSRRRGAEAVQSALDVITEHIPRLDLALVNRMPFFSTYSLLQSEDIATSPQELLSRIGRKDAVFILDASFMETSEQFLSVAEEYGNRATIIIPYPSLSSIVDTAEDNVIPCFDESVGVYRKHERATARQRLRQLSSVLEKQNAAASPSNANSGRDGVEKSESTLGGGGGGGGRQVYESEYPHVMLLHFSECLLANMLPSSFDQLHPESDVNDQLACIGVMLRALLPSECDVSICTDDPVLVKKLTSTTGEDWCYVFDGIRVVSTPISDLRSDAPSKSEEGEAVNLIASVASTFEPRIQETAPLSRAASASSRVKEEEGPAAQKELFSQSSWLSMLDDDVSSTTNTVAPTASTQEVEPSSFLNKPNATFPAQNQDEQHTPKQNDEEEVFQAPYALESLQQQQQRILDDMNKDMFRHFSAKSPDVAMEKEQRAVTPQTHSGDDQQRWRRLSPLALESLRNRGYSKKARGVIARQLSNTAGGRVPFHFKYNVYEANVNDPRNAHLKKSFDAGYAIKRQGMARRSGGGGGGGHKAR